MTKKDRTNEWREAIQAIAQAGEEAYANQVQLAQGDTVYLIDGTEAFYEMPIANANKHVVSVIFTFGDGEYTTSTQIVEQVFSEPPVVRMNTRIQQMEQAIHEKQALLTKLQEEELGLREVLRQYEKLKTHHPAFLQVDDFLANRYQFVVINQKYGAIQILPFAEAMKAEEGGYAKSGMKLLSLFGKSNGDLQWRLHEYSTGSSDTEEIFPCKSREEAFARAQEIVTARGIAIASEKNHWGIDNFIRSVEKLNRDWDRKFEIPPAFLELHLAIKKASLRNNLESYKAKVAELAAELNQLEGEE